MQSKEIFLILAIILAILLVLGIYKNVKISCRITLLLILELVIGVIGKNVWESYGIYFFPIVPIAITILIGIIGGAKSREVTGMIFLLLMTILIIGKIISIQPLEKKRVITTEVNKQEKVEDDNLEKESQEDSILKVNCNDNQQEEENASSKKDVRTIQELSDDEIRATKEPVLINGYLHFYQNQFPDVEWPGGNNDPDEQTLPYNGCSITSLAVVLTNFGVDVNPEEITNYLNSLDDNLHKDEGGPKFNMFYNLAEHYNFPGDCIPQVPKERVDQVVNCLENGGMVISRQTKGEFTGAGHYIVICDIDENNDVLVLDPNVNNIYKEEERNFRYDLSEITVSANDDENGSWWLFYPVTV